MRDLRARTVAATLLRAIVLATGAAAGAAATASGPKRAIKMALTCGEEAGSAFEGAEYLVKHERQLIDAAFALNEFAYGVLDADGHRVVMEIEAGE